MTNYKFIIKQFNPEILAEMIVQSENLSKDNCPENCFVRKDCNQEGECKDKLIEWFRKTRDDK